MFPDLTVEGFNWSHFLGETHKKKKRKKSCPASYTYTSSDYMHADDVKRLLLNPHEHVCISPTGL